MNTQEYRQKSAEALGLKYATPGKFAGSSLPFIDRYGNEITEEGKFKVEFKGFLDKDGKVVEKKADKVDEPDESTPKPENDDSEALGHDREACGAWLPVGCRRW